MKRTEKHAVITGASRGLGRYIAERLARSKDISSLTLISKNPERLSDAVAALKKTGPKLTVCGICADLATEKGVNGAISEMRKMKLDFNVLINNASASTLGQLDELTPQDIRSIVNLNLTAPLLLARFVIPYARKHEWGRIINISSISVSHISPLIIPYIVSKAGLNKLTECVHVAESARGLTCNTIMPGLMLTDMGRQAIRYSFPSYGGKNSREIEKKILRQFPVNTFTQFGDVYKAVEFLLSGKASCISGEHIRIASGLL